VGVSVEKLDEQWSITSLADAGDASLLPGIILPESDAAQKTISDIADALLHALAEKDMGSVKQFVHPEQGVRFSPYSFVDVEHHIVMMPEDVEQFFQDDTEYQWGIYDGKGDPIIMNPADYYNEFIFDLDFRHADEVSYN